MSRRKRKPITKSVLKEFEFTVEYNKENKWIKLPKTIYQGEHYHDAWFNCVSEVQNKHGKYPVRNSLN